MQQEEIGQLAQLLGGVIGVLTKMGQEQQDAERKNRFRAWLTIGLTAVAAAAAVVAVIITSR